MKNIFIPLDPYTCYPEWATRFLTEAHGRISLRPVYITKDLRILHGWLHESLLSNARKSYPFGKLIFHFGQLLESTDGQSLMVLLDSVPLIQFDLLDIELDDLYTAFPTFAGDVIIDILFNAQKLNSLLLKSAIELLQSIISADDGINELYIRIPYFPDYLKPVFLDVGWEVVCSGESLNPSGDVLHYSLR